jgi:RHS repeat-associated protein
MRQVKHDGAVAMNYLYNGIGERVYRTGSGQTVTTVYDEAGHWIGDYDATGQPIQQAIWLDDLPVGLLIGAGANQKLFYIEADALGTPRVLIDPDRDVAVWRWNLADEAFGDSVPNQDPDGDGTAFVFDMRFPGQRYDSASGLNYNYFRDYEPGTGRYSQSDPIGLEGGVSTYSYANGSPLVYADPEGLIAGYVVRFIVQRAASRQGLRLGGGYALRKFGPRGVGAELKRRAKRQADGQRSSSSSSCTRKCPPSSIGPGQDLFVGTYNVSRRGNIKSGLNGTHTPHHVVQNAATVSTTHGRGITINILKDLHELTWTFGRNADLGCNYRNLAMDIRNLRKILGNAGYDRSTVNQQMKELIRLNREVGNIL